jgi:8-oxo-dGTP pyrophosphatase MutT (NUDIX family)
VTHEFDPHTVPVRHAATVMLVDDRPDLHVLLVRRTANMVFASDAWVFPGGRVDPEDHEADLERLCLGLSDTDASHILDVPHGGLAWWLAACRETLEEAGLLLLADDPPNGLDLAALRRRVRENESVFPDLLLEHGLSLDVSFIEEVARFITPVGSPRRFDARFFLARTPPGQEPEHDDNEIVDWEWVRPTDALARYRAGEMTMISPTVRMVACLERYASADEALAVAKRRLPYQRVRVIDPAGEYRVVLPGEEGYEHAELEVESGWVRLWDPDAAHGSRGAAAPGRPW